MRAVKSIMNRSEESVLRELEDIAKDNALRVFCKVRVSDVLEKAGDILTNREFQMFSMSHFDFVVTDLEFRPVMAIEYDGAYHSEEKQAERDFIKNNLCQRACLGLLRINSKHVTRMYRGMTLLRWIVEVYQMQESFYKSYSEGLIPYDFDFDPLMFTGTGKNGRFQYWISAPATINIHKFLDNVGRETAKGWFSLNGTAEDGKICKLSYIRVDDKVVSAFTSVRQQDIDLPYYTLLDEISKCEIGTRLSMFQRGALSAVSIDSFRIEFDKFRERFKATPSHSMGNHPFHVSWDGRDWK